MTMLIPTNRKNNETTRTFPSISSWFDEIINRNFDHELMSNFNTGMTLPAVNVKDESDRYLVEMAVPGMSKSDFDIHVDNQVLTISAEQKSETNEESDNYTRREFGYSSFKRTFNLPKTVNSEKISAQYTDGILKIELPKIEEAKKKPLRTIKIS